LFAASRTDAEQNKEPTDTTTDTNERAIEAPEKAVVGLFMFSFALTTFRISDLRLA
jgi:hypothetical protein